MSSLEPSKPIELPESVIKVIRAFDRKELNSPVPFRMALLDFARAMWEAMQKEIDSKQ